MLWQEVDLHHARVRQIIHLIEARYVRYASPGAYIDEYLVSFQRVAIDLDLIWDPRIWRVRESG